MSITPTFKSSLFLGLILLSGCFQPKTTTDDAAGDGASDGGGASGGSGAGGSGGGSGSGQAATIYDIQMNSFEEGTVVSIEGAIVTSQITEGENPAFFVQSAEGGNTTASTSSNTMKSVRPQSATLSTSPVSTEFYGLSN